VTALLSALALAPATAEVYHPGMMEGVGIARVLFWAFAAMVIVGAISTITRKNDVAAVMSLVATFFGLAAVYTFLSAHFLAVLQVLVYAGAIMVLFIFVVMVLNRDETDPWVWRGVVGKVLLGVLPVGILTWQLIGYLHAWHTPNPGVPPDSFGTVAEVGNLLFTEYLFAFEAVSVLLLIAVIAAVVVARTVKNNEIDRQHVSGASPYPEHRFGEPQTGATYAAHAVATPPHQGGGPHD
jgi:NADH-quinone oxidoreductase subunit J